VNPCSAAPSLAPSTVSCATFHCPVGQTLVPQPEKLMCYGGVCDALTCCLQATTTTHVTCATYVCPPMSRLRARAKPCLWRSRVPGAAMLYQPHLHRHQLPSWVGETTTGTEPRVWPGGLPTLYMLSASDDHPHYLPDLSLSTRGG